MKTIAILDKLRTKSVFRIQDIERAADCNREYAKQMAHNLKKRMLIKEIRRNAYTTKDNIFVIASNIVFPSYISFWSASYFLGYTEQILNTLQIATTRRIGTILFEDHEIRFVPMKHFFGFRKILTDDGYLSIVEDEKLLIDAFLRPDECGNFDEIEKIFQNSKISKGKIVEYLRRIDNQSLIKRVGFMLGKTRNMDISESFKLDSNYSMLNPFADGWSEIDKKWQVKI